MRYSCNLRGRCEEDPVRGRFFSPAECQADCQALPGQEDFRDAVDIIMAYNPEQTLEAAPSDRVRIIRRLTGVTVESDNSWDDLFAILTNNYPHLYFSPNRLFQEYLRNRLDELDFLLLELLQESPRPPIDWSATRILAVWSIQELFLEPRDIYAFVDLQDEPPQSLAELEERIQLYVALDLIDILGVLHNELEHHAYIQRVREYWPYLLQRFGPELPYRFLLNEG